MITHYGHSGLPTMVSQGCPPGLAYTVHTVANTNVTLSTPARIMERLEMYARAHVGKNRSKITQTAVRRLFERPDGGFQNLRVHVGDGRRGSYFVMGGAHGEARTGFELNTRYTLLPYVLRLVVMLNDGTSKASELHEVLKEACKVKRNRVPMGFIDKLEAIMTEQ